MAKQLTPQQTAVMVQLAMGLKNTEIAEVLGISERTVQSHLSDIFERLQASNRVEALVILGWVTIPKKYLEA